MRPFVESEIEVSEKHHWPPCQFCGKPSKNIMFAAFICDSEACINKAMDARGGPAGHKKNRAEWLKK